MHMHTVEKRHSYGVIPLIGTPDAYEVLLIEQRDSFVVGYWTFPKGTPEGGESPLETAIRETKEEVGVVCEEIDTDFSYTETYNFERDGVLIEKSVTYFAGRARTKDTHIQEAEVLSVKWCTEEEAVSLLRFEGAQKVLRALGESGVIARLLYAKSV